MVYINCYSWAFFTSSDRFYDIHIKNVDLENVGQGHNVQIRSGAIRWQMLDTLSNGNSSVCIFPTLSILTLDKFDLENLDQRHGSTSFVMTIWWQISTFIKVILEYFLLALTIFMIFSFFNSQPWQCGSRSWHTPFTVWCYSMANISLPI